MRTSVASTSLTVYDEYKVHFQAQELLVLSVIRKHREPLTIGEIAKELNLPDGRVSARLAGLRKKKAVIEDIERKCRVGRKNCKTWRERTPDDEYQLNLPVRWRA